MDFLNQATGQLRELMLSMTPAARVTALLLLGVIGVSMGYLVQHQSASPDDYLFNGEFLPGSVVDRAEAAIAQAGLEGYVREGNRIKVPRNRKGTFLAAVADAGALPTNFHEIMDKANNPGAFASSDTRRGMYKSGREEQLSHLIRDMDGIEDANVVFDIKEAQGLGRHGIATATVSVRPKAGESLNMRQVKMIRKAVAGAIAELSPEEVVVMNRGDGSTYGGGEEITSDSFDDPYYPIRLAYEKKMQSKIEDLLRSVPGVRVQVSAELETTLERTTQTLEPKGEAAAIRETTLIESDKVSELNKGGRPGLAAQGPLRNNNETPTVTVKNDRTVESGETENFIGRQNEFVRSAALVPRSVQTAIAVPTNYLLSVWGERERKKGKDPNEPLPTDIDEQLGLLKGEVVESIENMVVPLLPKRQAEDNFSKVQVTFFESLTPEPVEGPTTASQALGWASQNFNTMTMAVVALVGLMMLRSMVKSIPAPAPATEMSGPALAVSTVEGAAGEGADGEAGDGEGGKRQRLRLKKGVSLKDDLVEIVREDPDAAAAILRSWIGNAG